MGEGSDMRRVKERKWGCGNDRCKKGWWDMLYRCSRGGDWSLRGNDV
jgi:hypothetical protein